MRTHIRYVNLWIMLGFRDCARGGNKNETGTYIFTPHVSISKIILLYHRKTFIYACYGPTGYILCLRHTPKQERPSQY